MGKNKKRNSKIDNDNNNNNDVCPICLDNVDSGDITTLDCCNHKYHTDCIEKWNEHETKGKHLNMMMPLNNYPPSLDEIVKMIVYLDDGLILRCPTCQSQYDGLGKLNGGEIKPSRILGKIRYAPLTPDAPSPTHYITAYEQLFLYLPKNIKAPQALMVWGYNFQLLVGGMRCGKDIEIQAVKCHCNRPDCPKLFLLNSAILSKSPAKNDKNLKPLRVDELKNLVADQETTRKSFELLRKLRML